MFSAATCTSQCDRSDPDVAIKTYAVKFSFEICCGWKRVTVRAHIGLMAHFRPVSPTSILMALFRTYRGGGGLAQIASHHISMPLQHPFLKFLQMPPTFIFTLVLSFIILSNSVTTIAAFAFLQPSVYFHVPS